MTLHRVVGVCLFHITALELARRHFERVLELRGEDFGAYVRLALIAYRLGDYASWHRECSHARRLDPSRYARLKHPFELFEGRDGAGNGTELPPWRRSVRLSRFASAREQSPFDSLAGDSRMDRELVQGERNRIPAGDTDGVADPLRLPVDDFASESERARFRSRAPIGMDEVRATDFDELSRRLG